VVILVSVQGSPQRKLAWPHYSPCAGSTIE